MGSQPMKRNKYIILDASSFNSSGSKSAEWSLTCSHKSNFPRQLGLWRHDRPSNSSLTETYWPLQLYFSQPERRFRESGLLRTIWEHMLCYPNRLNITRVNVLGSYYSGKSEVIYCDPLPKKHQLKVASKTSLTVYIPPETFTSIFSSCQVFNWSPLLLNSFTPCTYTFSVPMPEPYMW